MVNGKKQSFPKTSVLARYASNRCGKKEDRKGKIQEKEEKKTSRAMYTVARRSFALLEVVQNIKSINQSARLDNLRCLTEKDNNVWSLGLAGLVPADNAVAGGHGALGNSGGCRDRCGQQHLRRCSLAARHSTSSNSA